MSRMQRARALLNDREREQGSSSTAVPSGLLKDISDSFDSGLLECRSDRSGGEMSSDLMNPRWRRLIVSVSGSLAQRFSDATLVPDGCMAEFVHTDATGGGSQMDLQQCFEGALHAMELSDKSAGFVLIGAYYYLIADDVVLTSQTWRSLVVTALLVAANEMCERAEHELAIRRLRQSAAHWWSEDRADRAVQVFKLREAFVQKPLNQQKIAALYFELRASALEIAPFDDDSHSGAAIADFPLDHAPVRNPNVKASNSLSGRNGDPADRSNERSNASLAFSDSRSRSTYNDGYTSDHSVFSI